MFSELKKTADKIRMTIFTAIAQAGGGHFGGVLSEIEILTVLYFSELKIDPKNPGKKDRDRFVLSKGHGGPGLYATLAERGFFPKEWLKELDKSGSRLPKHVDRFKLPGIDISSGALGQGLSAGVGMALAAKLDSTGVRVYVLLGDGECDEGQVWEAVMTASKYRLDNLVAIIDNNRLQVDGPCGEVMPNEPMKERWKAFGWETKTADGHNTGEISAALKAAREIKGKPVVIIARTVKGKGISYMEGKYEWHSGKVSEEQFKQGVKELKAGKNQ